MAITAPILGETTTDGQKSILTNDQIQRINDGRKDTRPKYFDALSEKENTISLDFEAYLILISATLKNAIIAQLKKVKKEGSKRKDRDEVLTVALTEELKNAETMYQAWQVEVKAFTDFRDKLTVDNFGEVVELGQLITTLQFSIDEQLLNNDRTEQLATFMTVFQIAFNGGKLTDNVIKEINSWITVVQEYL
jgi:hypothetical protein